MIWLCGKTDIGKKRSSNQDIFLTSQLQGGGLMMVCDGMGGENGGDAASRLALEAACRIIKSDLAPNMSEMSVRRVLESAGAAANGVVFETACNDRSLTGMGTTMVGVVILNGCANFIHAGDSRAYLLRDNILTQLTVDHTVVQMLINRGEITAQDAATHPKRNMITRAVGVSPRLKYDIFSIDLKMDDIILLCSDGLYNYVEHSELTALTVDAVQRRDISGLIERANQNGGGDNITATVCLIAEGDEL